MRAVVVHEFGTPESLPIEDIASPQAGPDEILIDVRAVGVNFVDLLVIGGTYQFLPPRPFTPGKLPAGQVIAVGANVTDFVVGLKPRAETVMTAVCPLAAPAPITRL